MREDIGYVINFESEKVGIQNLNHYFASTSELVIYEGNLKALVFLDSFENIFCAKNNLECLKLANGAKKVDCSSNNLKELELPDGVKKVDCRHNESLEKLVLPEEIEEVYCSRTNIKDLQGPSLKNIKHLRCDGRLFTKRLFLKKVIESPYLETIVFD